MYWVGEIFLIDRIILIIFYPFSVADKIASHGVTPNPEQQSIIDDLLFSLDQPGPSDDMWYSEYWKNRRL